MTSNASYILLVDDDPSNLFLLEELLHSEGYQTQSALSGSEALAIAQQDQPALILLDVMMPEMDGFEVCQRLRADPGLQLIPVIFLTALVDDEARLKGLESLGDDYLTKPIQASLVLAKIASLMRLNQLRVQQSQARVRQEAKEQSYRQMTAAWQINEALSEKFRLFVPEQVLCRIAPQGVESIQLGNATEAEVSILFCDIRGFTAIAETQSANETFEWLNAFFTGMNEAITAHYGFIDKFLGDAMMAVFDRPGNHAQDALSAAVMMRKLLAEFNSNRLVTQLAQPIKIGIGIHSGIAVIGTIGSEHRMDSTVIGDVVNTASRLEELTKVYGCPIIASDAAIAYLDQPNLFHYRWIDCIVPRGKQQENDLYEILGTQTTVIDVAKARSQPLFAQAMQAWQQQNWPIALTYFQAVAAEDTTDSVAALYITRCQERLGCQSPLV